jgi:hypothetical protein
MQFDVEYYRRRSFEQANAFRHSTLQLFSSIHMRGIYSRFEDAFKGHDNAALCLAGKQSSTLPSSEGIDSSGFDTETHAEKEETGDTTDEQPPPEQQQQEQDERKTAHYFNFVILPYDSSVAPGAQPPLSSKSTTTAAAGKHGSSSSGVKPSPSSTTSLSSTTSFSSQLSSPASMLLQSTMSQLSISFNSYNALGASLKQPYRDVFGTSVQDREKWKVWTKGLRNKILSLSMRPQGGPALGPRNRPGMVSEREWYEGLALEG